MPCNSSKGGVCVTQGVDEIGLFALNDVNTIAVAVTFKSPLDTSNVVGGLRRRRTQLHYILQMKRRRNIS